MQFDCIILCDERSDAALRQGIQGFSQQGGRSVRTEWYRRPEQLLYRLRDGPCCDMVVVAVPGARGMEAAMGVREQAPCARLVWCSDDRDFAIQSYRLQTAMFLLLPIQTGQIEEALKRCVERKGERLS